ncbi:MAG: hypothetical protein P4L35_02830 [Ignavibacteriaceae bacterium]|nr:hypothetical protein [Ignavibacteriaceae bacterium]
MGKAVLILLLGSMAIFGVINLFNNNNVKRALGSSVNYYSDTQARDIGNSTMQMIMSQLADSNSWRVTTAQTLSLLNGKARYTVVDSSSPNTNNMVKATVYSYCNNVDTNVVKPKTIVAYIHLPVQSIPPFMTYAVLSGGNLLINSSSSVSFSGGSALVQVNGTGTVNSSSSISGTFTSPYAPIVTSGSSVTTSSIGPVVPIPTFNPAAFTSLAQPADIYNSDYKLNSSQNANFTLGDSAHPRIIIINGNLILNSSSKITYTGYGAILVNGNVTVSSSSNIINQSLVGGSLGLYVTGNFSLSSSSEIDANILVEGSLVGAASSVIIKGSLIANNNISFNSQAHIYYQPSVVSITQLFWSTPSRPSDVRYYLE